MKIFFTSNLMLIILIVSINLYSQSDSTYQNTENTLNNILDNPNEAADNSALYNIIEQLQQNPVNLNKCSISDLEQIPAIDYSTAKLIIKHREKYGKYFSIYELNSIKGLDSDEIRRILPFVTVNGKQKRKSKLKIPTGFTNSFYKNINLKIRSRIIRNLQPQAGFLKNKYLGTPFNSYNRILIDYSNHYQIGLLTQKDPGESSLDEFKSFHLQIKNFGIVQNIIAGDYLVQFGQGLALWSPYGFSKGVDAIYPVKKKSRNIIAYTSSDENRFFRGAAFNFKISSFNFSLFYSRNYFDANIDSVSDFILSTPISGYHRTRTEIMKKHSANELMYGTKLNYSKPDVFNFGLLFYKSKFSNRFTSELPYGIRGNSFYYVSYSYDLYYKNLNIFGESSFDGNSVASIGNLQIQITNKLTYLISLRSYPRNYINLHGFGFGEKSGNTKNEFGIYNGIKWKTFLGTFNFYYDQFKFPFASLGLPLPSEGNEALLFFNSKPVKNLIIRLKFKYENKDVSIKDGLTKSIIRRIRKSVRFELIDNISKFLQLKGRFEYNKYNLLSYNRQEEGYLYLQSIKLKIINAIDIYSGITFFNTDSFNSAIYEYENDLTGMLSNYAMYGSGIRWYLMIHYRPVNFITASCKYAETVKPGSSHLSSGNNEIIGDLDNWFSFQLDVSL